jgi:ParB/RepB/Spo0J family partition protein
VVCGFRRLHAVISLGWKKIPAMVRTDLNDDLHALQTSVLENEQRQSYSSVERAYAMVALKNSGYSNRMLSSLFRVGKRQLQRLCKLTTFPESLQSYVAEGRIPLN